MTMCLVTFPHSVARSCSLLHPRARVHRAPQPGLCATPCTRQRLQPALRCISGEACAPLQLVLPSYSRVLGLLGDEGASSERFAQRA
jgi:hypothetical protein